MTWVSIVAIYSLFWVLTAFVVLPFGVKNHEELAVATLPGEDRGAPANFNPKTILLRTTALSAFLFALYYSNYIYGVLDRHSFDGLFTWLQ